MIDDFIDSVEDTYGKYKPGMKKAIIDKLSRINQQDERKLLNSLIASYDMGRPPNLKAIMEVMYKSGISLSTQGYGGMSVCEHCNFEYDQDLVACPKCNKTRIYGVVKLYKMGEGQMHPFAIMERQNEIKKTEPTQEEARKFQEFMQNTGGIRGMLKNKVKNLRVK